MNSRIRVSFEGVRGGLTSAGRPSGFSVRDGDGHEVAWIYKVELAGGDAVIHVDQLTRPAFLWYGYGIDPYCNITDSEGAGVPAFGPIAL